MERGNGHGFRNRNVSDMKNTIDFCISLARRQIRYMYLKGKTSYSRAFYKWYAIDVQDSYVA